MPKARRLSLVLAVTASLALLVAGSYHPGMAQTGGGYQVFLPMILKPVRVYLPLVHKPLPAVWIGPGGGSPGKIVIDPINPRIVYVGSWGAGVFKSYDGGSTWVHASAGLRNLYINALAIDPVDPQILYAGPYQDRMYKTSDGGITWSESSAGIQSPAVIYGIAVNPKDHNQVYASTRGYTPSIDGPYTGVLYKSSNGGANWTPKLANIGGSLIQDWVYSIAVSSRSPNVIFAASHMSGPFRSSDYGEHWVQAASGVVDGSGRAVGIDPWTADPQLRVFFGVWHRTGVYRSDNSGASWYLVSNGLPATKVMELAIDASQPSNVYLATYTDGILKTGNYGGSWNSTGFPDAMTYSVAVNPGNHLVVYAGTVGDGLWKSENGGAGWIQVQADFANSNITGLAAMSGGQNVLFAASMGGGVSRSTDQGASWSTLNANLPDKLLHGLALDPSHPQRLYALTESAGLLVNDLSTGSGWVSLSAGLPVRPAALTAYASQSLIPRLDAVDSAQLGPLPMPRGPEAFSFYSAPVLNMAFAPDNPSLAYLGTADGLYTANLSTGGAWHLAGLAGQAVVSIAPGRSAPGEVFAAVNNGGGGGVMVSRDYGRTWQDTSLSGAAPLVLYISPAHPQSLYAGTDRGLFVRRGDSPWTPVGLAGHKVLVIAQHPVDPSRLYAGTEGAGAYLSLDGGASWSAGPSELAGLTIQAIGFDPSNPDTIYYATQSQGILRQN